MSSHHTMTTAEYLRTPESVLPTELIYGVLRVAESPLPRHQAVVFDLGLALAEHVRERRLGEVWLAPFDVILDAGRSLIIQPDLFFVSNERGHIMNDRVRGAPIWWSKCSPPIPASASSGSASSGLHATVFRSAGWSTNTNREWKC